MQVVETNPLPSSPLFKDYLFDFAKVERYFSYNPQGKERWNERLDWLARQSYINRTKLVEALTAYNKQINNHEAVLANIEKLRSNESFVVIGGQQAGIFTGPLYVIHKAISILKLAEEMKQTTSKEIIPVFWIASEDHDFAEVNHVFLETAEGDIKKVRLSEKGKPKASVSHLKLPANELEGTIHEYFSYFADSPYHQELKSVLMNMVKNETTLSDMFARIISYLFGKYGLVLVDSADPQIRELEVPIFSKLINNNLEEPLLKREEELVADGYRPQLENLEGNAHFFLHLDGERHLMMRAQNQIISKNGKHRFTEAELTKLLLNDSSLFSANVVSRPIMQEYLFPVAAFIGGPGEVAYWAQLKPIFEFFNLQMPIVFPRLTFTIIERNIANYMDRFHLGFEDACKHWGELRDQWIERQGAGQIGQEFSSFTNQLCDLYQPFIDKISKIEPGSRKLGEANWGRIQAHLDFLQKKTIFAMEKRHEASLKQWTKIRQALQPLDLPQERVYNVFGYLNKYGTSLIEDILAQPISLKPNHKLIYI